MSSMIIYGVLLLLVELNTINVVPRRLTTP
jgi:hypothetical protein